MRATSTSHSLFPVCNEIPREISNWGTLHGINAHGINRFKWPRSCKSDYGSDGTTARRLSSPPIRHRARQKNDHEFAAVQVVRETTHKEKPCPSINRRQPKNKQTLQPFAHYTHRPKPQQKTRPNLCPTSQ